MRYSKWQPDRGGYAYYETSERLGLSDDLPTPRLSATSVIGVASTGVGRPMPLGAKLVGYGPLPQGQVAPMDRSNLSGLDSITSNPLNLLLMAAGLVGAAYVGARAVKAVR